MLLLLLLLFMLLFVFVTIIYLVLWIESAPISFFFTGDKLTYIHSVTLELHVLCHVLLQVNTVPSMRKVPLLWWQWSWTRRRGPRWEWSKARNHRHSSTFSVEAWSFSRESESTVMSVAKLWCISKAFNSIPTHSYTYIAILYPSYIIRAKKKYSKLIILDS